jgi:hypothetical protein
MPADRVDSQDFRVNFFDASRGEPLSSRANPGLTPPSRVQGTTDVRAPPMAPSVGGFNIAPPVPRVVDAAPPRVPPSWTSIEKTLEYLTGTPVSNALPATDLLSSHVNPGPISPSTFQATPDVRTPPMAPGVGGFNIEPPVARLKPKLADADPSRERPTGISIAKTFDDPMGFGSPIGCHRFAQGRTDGADKSMLAQFGMVAAANDVAVQDRRRQHRSSLETNPVPKPPIRAERKAVVVSTGRSSLVFTLLGIAAIVTVMLLAFANEARNPVGAISEVMPSLRPVFNSAASLAARLVIESQKGFTNEPLPLGVSVKNPSGEEYVTVTGLADGTQLSLGTPIGRAGWVVSARDLDNTFIGPRHQFVGVMDATVTLHSIKGQLLDSQVVRFEWTEKR